MFQFSDAFYNRIKYGPLGHPFIEHRRGLQYDECTALLIVGNAVTGERCGKTKAEHGAPYAGLPRGSQNTAHDGSSASATSVDSATQDAEPHRE